MFLIIINCNTNHYLLQRISAAVQIGKTAAILYIARMTPTLPIPFFLLKFGGEVVVVFVCVFCCFSHPFVLFLIYNVHCNIYLYGC